MFLRASTPIPLAPAGTAQIDAAQQRSELFDRDLKSPRARFTTGDGIAAFFQALGPDRESISVPIEDLEPVSSLVQEQIQMAGEGIQLEMIAHQRVQPIEAPAHVARAQTQVHAHAGRRVNHGRNASSTSRSVAASTPLAMRSRSPLASSNSSGAVLATVFSSANCTGSETDSAHTPSLNVRQRDLSTNSLLGATLANSGAATATTPIAAIGIAHQRCARAGARTPGGASVTISDCVSITDVTTAAGWVVGLAIVALIAIGWRKPARATADVARARRPLRAPTGAELHELQAPLYTPTSIWRRIWSLVASSALAVWLGAVTATVLGFASAWIVITLTSMLKR